MYDQRQYQITKSFSEQLKLRDNKSMGQARKKDATNLISQSNLNCDILGGFLDLPRGSVSIEEIEKYLKIHALFSEHIIIPDGWMHCTGPISEYLRKRYGESLKAKDSKIFDNNTFFELLDAGIIVPGLRGQHPSDDKNGPIGYDIMKVWEGSFENSFGVYFPPEDKLKRMTILDQENEDNRKLLEGIAKNTRLFVDWTSPHISINTPGFKNTDDLKLWDKTFSDFTFDLLYNTDSPLTIMTEGYIEYLNSIGLLDDPKVKSEAEAFWGELQERMSELVLDGNYIRRGSVEKIVGSLLGYERLEGYQVLKEHSKSLEVMPNPFYSRKLRNQEYFNLKATLGLHLLDRVTTIQEALFSLKFNCSPNMCPGYSQELIDVGLLKISGISHQAKFKFFDNRQGTCSGYHLNVGYFVPFLYQVQESSLPLSTPGSYIGFGNILC